MMHFAVEPFEQWYQEAQPLFRAHWEAVGADRDALALAPQWARWIELDRAGAALCVTARVGWRLEGYAIHLITPSLLYGGRLVASAHALYIQPRQLAGMAALRLSRLVAFCDGELAARGVAKAWQAEKVGHDMSAVFERNGYQLEELGWSRVLAPRVH